MKFLHAEPSSDGEHSCALLACCVRSCWGSNGIKILGYGNLDIIGDETPAAVGPVPVS